MHKHALRILTLLAAMSVSGLAVALAWASSMQRAASAHDQMLLAALSVVIVLSAHLLPALLRRRHPLVLWPVWFLCLCLAGYGHASWFYLSGQSAAEVREAGSAAVVAAARERAAIEQTLSTIKARPVAQVARQLSLTTNPDRRSALADELAEARRAAGLRDRLILISGNTGKHVTGLETAGNAGETWRVTDLTLVMSVVAALLIEVLGALLWSVALVGDDDDERSAQPVHAGGVDVVDELADLRAAIAHGTCVGTVRGIRQYMGCRMGTASRLKKQLELSS